MKTINTISAQKIAPGKESQPVLPPDYPVIKPEIQPERERSEPIHPLPEIQPAPQPEIKPEKRQ